MADLVLPLKAVYFDAIRLGQKAEEFRLKISGLVDTPLDLSLDALKQLGEPISLVAAHQCSGNSRGFFEPRANGGQLGHGAMGNAKWTGVSLKRVLEKAGIQKGAVQVSFNGMDKPPIDGGPDFVKALNIDHALEGLPSDAGEQALAAVVRAALGPTPQLFGITPEGIAVAVRRAIDTANDGSTAGAAS